MSWIPPAAWLLSLLFRAVGGSCRLRLVTGAEHLDHWRRSRDPAILLLWHHQVFLGGAFLYRCALRGGKRLAVLASHSRDGELGARVAASLGAGVVRGSSSRGGREALRGLQRAILQQALSPILAPDGPRGPSGRVQLGALALAQVTGAPLLPLGLASSAGWRLGSWDRMVVPRPWSRIAVAVGAPLSVPRSASADALAARRSEVERLLDRLSEEAAAGLG